MRIIYYDDIKKGFKFRKLEVEFLDRLYLSGFAKRTTTAPPKDQVDILMGEGLSNIIENLILTDPEYNLNGDVIKTAKAYMLKMVFKAGRYCNVVTDEKGRVIGGETNIDKVKDVKLPTLDFSNIDTTNHKSKGHKNNPELSYLDWLNDKPKLYLNIYSNNKLTETLKIEKNIFEKDGVLNEEGMEVLLDLLIDPRLRFLHHYGYDGQMKEQSYDEEGGLITYDNPEFYYPSNAT